MSASERSSRPQWDERTNQTLTLEDGRTLGYAEFGPKDGHPVFDLHGLPGSRFEGKLFESAAFEHQARIISVDRPGVGLSSPQPGRTALDHAKDIQAVAAHLKITTFSVMGVSGGGPYALACAYAIPTSQLKNVALLAGCAEYKAETAKGMFAANQWMFWALQAGFLSRCGADIFVRIVFGKMLWSSDEELDAKMRDKMKGVPPEQKDKVALEEGETHWVLLAEIREHFKQDFAAYTEDGKIIAGDLGFDLADVQSDEVGLWYGKHDTNVPPEIGEDYARRLKDKARLKIENETHVSLVVNCNSEVIRYLVERANH